MGVIMIIILLQKSNQKILKTIHLFTLKKCITFSVRIEKEVTRIDENGEEITKKYILHITIY